MKRSFTLIEIVIVLVIIAAVTSLMVRHLVYGSALNEHRAFRNQVKKSFINARLQAEMTGRETYLTFLKEDERYQLKFEVSQINGDLSHEREEVFQEAELMFDDLPAGIQITSDFDQAYIFYPNGEAEGPKTTIDFLDFQYTIEVDRLNGQLILDEK